MFVSVFYSIFHIFEWICFNPVTLVLIWHEVFGVRSAKDFGLQYQVYQLEYVRIYYCNENAC
jgi:hypothetical protein